MATRFTGVGLSEVSQSQRASVSGAHPSWSPVLCCSLSHPSARLPSRGSNLGIP